MVPWLGEVLPADRRRGRLRWVWWCRLGWSRTCPVVGFLRGAGVSIEDRASDVVARCDRRVADRRRSTRQVITLRRGLLSGS